jgi:hypothetical protein
MTLLGLAGLFWLVSNTPSSSVLILLVVLPMVWSIETYSINSNTDIKQQQGVDNGKGRQITYASVHDGRNQSISTR